MKPVLLLYFLRRIGGAIALLWTAFLALLIFFELLRKTNDEPLATALLLAVLKSPHFAIETLPFACAIGAAVAMRRMVSDGEMPALRTSGLSPAMLVAFLLAAAMPFVAVYLFLSEALLPAGADLARALQNKSGAVHGLWLADGDDYIRIQKIDSGGVMLSVAIYHTRDGQLTALTRAARADYRGDGWMLHDVWRLDNGASALAGQRQARLAWPLPLQPSTFDAFTERPRDMALADAMHAAAQLADAGQKNADLHKTIWQRLLTLPALLLLTAFGVQFIGDDRRSRYAVSLPVLLAALAAGVYLIARDMAIQASQLGDAPPLLLLPPLLFAAYLAYKINRVG